MLFVVVLVLIDLRLIHWCLIVVLYLIDLALPLLLLLLVQLILLVDVLLA